MRHLAIIAHNVRSAHNVGSLLRTADGLGVETVYLTGYTPYPLGPDDDRLPHLSTKLHAQISKTALGAEKSQPWYHIDSISQCISDLKKKGFVIAALEQTKTAIALPDYQPPPKLALIVGREVEGLETEVLEDSNIELYIPMYGQKESFNVVQAAAMALYHCRFAINTKTS